MNLNTAGWASRVLTPLLRVVRGATNATVPVIAISEPVNSETAALVNADVALVAKGTGATLAQVPDGTAVGGDKRGAFATDWQRNRTTATQIASGQYATIAGGSENTAGTNSWATVSGGRNNTSTGGYATITGGNLNTASSTYSFVGGGQSNLAQTNIHAAVCGGNSNTASGGQSFIGGGQTNTASGNNAVVLGGSGNTSSATYSTIVSGQGHTANGGYSFIAGGRYGTTRGIEAYHVFPACSAPISIISGTTQSALLLLARQTTNDTAAVVTSNGNAAGTTNQVILPNNSAYSFSGEVIAGVTAAGNTARWTIDGAIKRGANAASTAMVGTPTVTMTHFDAGAATWVVAVTADTTNGGIAVTVTGAAATTIRWVCKINTTEMTF